MEKYKCPEGDYEQDMPGMCPNHPGVELEMVEEEGMEMKEGEETGDEEMEMKKEDGEEDTDDEEL